MPEYRRHMSKHNHHVSKGNHVTTKLQSLASSDREGTDSMLQFSLKMVGEKDLEHFIEKIQVPLVLQQQYINGA